MSSDTPMIDPGIPANPTDAAGFYTGRPIEAATPAAVTTELAAVTVSGTSPIEAKVGAAVLGGASTTLAVELLDTFTRWHPTPTAAAAIATLTAFAFGWLVPSRLWGRYDGDDASDR